MKKVFYAILNSVSAVQALVLVCLFYGLGALKAQATDNEQAGGTLQVVKILPLNQAQRATPEGLLAVDPLAFYSNVTTYSGSATTNGGSGTTSSNTTTRLIADDINLVGTPPFSIGAMRFSVANLNTVVVSARPRIRFYAADGVGGSPGTYITGFSFNAIAFTASSVTTYSATLSPFSITTNNIWAAMIYDNGTGATGATIAQMDNLGMGIYTPADVGTSTDNIFRTTANGGTGSFLVSNPVGATLNFAAAPVANLGWEMISSSTVNSIVRANPSPVLSGSSVSWTVNFSKVMSGLTAANFTLANTGLTSPSITTVTAVGATPTVQWTVTASTGSGIGSLGLNYTANTGANTAVTNILPLVGEIYTVQATIPVELLTFTARAKQQTVLLEWQTASEINNKGFQIEKQKASGGWDILGFVDAKGKGSTYDFTDPSPHNINYYRLRQMDVNGKETESKIVSVVSKSTNKLTIYPSLVKNTLTIELELGSIGEEKHFSIVNVFGQQVMTRKLSKYLDVSALSQGTYILSTDNAQAKFVKQ
jgi:Secretion system C-terminal sorting domain